MFGGVLRSCCCGRFFHIFNYTSRRCWSSWYLRMKTSWSHKGLLESLVEVWFNFSFDSYHGCYYVVMFIFMIQLLELGHWSWVVLFILSTWSFSWLLHDGVMLHFGVWHGLIGYKFSWIHRDLGDVGILFWLDIGVETIGCISKKFEEHSPGMDLRGECSWMSRGDLNILLSILIPHSWSTQGFYYLRGISHCSFQVLYVNAYRS